MTLKTHVDKINPGDNVIIGLGDSFTQGVGAYSAQTFKKIEKQNPSLYNITGQFFTDEQGQNNWVRQLTTNFLPEYKTMSLGVNGAGNRAAVKELYLNPLPDDIGNVIVILMATGMERFDFIKNEKQTSGPENHQKWRTIWPNLSLERGDIGVLEKNYAEKVWSEKTDVMEFLLNVAEAQQFCNSKGYRFVFGSAFSDRINKTIIESLLEDDVHDWINIVDWNDYICPHDCTDFMHYIRKLENNDNLTSFWKSQQYVSKLQKPLTYITPCHHWTPHGAKEVARVILEILKSRKMV